MSPDTLLPSQPLLDALLNEQRRSWRRGQRPPAEEFVARYPACESNPHGAASLAYHEFVLREALGESPDFGEYLRRFEGAGG